MPKTETVNDIIDEVKPRLAEALALGDDKDLDISLNIVSLPPEDTRSEPAADEPEDEAFDPEDDPQPLDMDPNEDGLYNADQIQALELVDLNALLVEYGYDELEDEDEAREAVFNAQAEYAENNDLEDPAAGGGEVTREYLEGLDIKAIREIAREAGYPTGKLSKAQLIDTLVGAEE